MSLKFLKRDENLEKKNKQKVAMGFSVKVLTQMVTTIICKALVYFQDEGAVRLWGKKREHLFTSYHFPV